MVHETDSKMEIVHVEGLAASETHNETHRAALEDSPETAERLSTSSTFAVFVCRVLFPFPPWLFNMIYEYLGTEDVGGSFWDFPSSAPSVSASFSLQPFLSQSARRLAIHLLSHGFQADGPSRPLYPSPLPAPSAIYSVGESLFSLGR